MSTPPNPAASLTPQSREVLAWFDAQGCRPAVDDDGDGDGDLRIVMFGRRYRITHQADDASYCRLAAHRIHAYDNAGREEAVAAVLEVTASTRVARCIVHGNHASVIAGDRCAEPARFIAVFDDLIGAVDHAVRTFRLALDEYAAHHRADEIIQKVRARG